VYKLLEIYNIKYIVYVIYISPNGTGNINARTAHKFRDYEEYRMIVVIRTVIRTAKTDVCRLCVAVTRTRARGLETNINAMHFWKSRLEFAFGRNKKGMVF